MTAVRKAAGWWTSLTTQVDDWQALSLMTLFMLARYSSFGEQMQANYGCLLAVAIIFRPVVREQTFWFLVLLATALPIVNNWWSQGGHAFLLLYWVGAIFLSFSAQEPRGMLAASGRYLIGATFFFAALWKFMSPEFADGTALQYFMATMIPIGLTTQVFTGLTQEQLQHNILAITDLLSQSVTSTVALARPPNIAPTAQVFTLLTQMLEGVLAVVFLAPLAGNKVILRDIALILFFITAYIILPIPSFAVLLACIGYAIASSPATRAFFLLAFFLWQIITLPFGN
ncbi:hypothetical protein LAJ19_17480 (plasmid) [Deinococcus taeanensis]|uniref:hypothetical protein n=1 Tax=Deinococcus taeanensis TaxID=2737050 RepID=UPI001CDBAF2B|nr:hypothetical protein [Deinococcus taeanensis]UBV44567.1 hypothetical protein LAJ19_17480 [Deinococcus taeanensis]